MKRMFGVLALLTIVGLSFGCKPFDCPPAQPKAEWPTVQLNDNSAALDADVIDCQCLPCSCISCKCGPSALKVEDNGDLGEAGKALGAENGCTLIYEIKQEPRQHDGRGCRCCSHPTTLVSPPLPDRSGTGILWRRI